MPAPTAAPARAGASNGQPAIAPIARPAPVPIAPPVTARWPQVSPQPDTESARGTRISAKTLVFMARTSRGEAAQTAAGDIFLRPRTRSILNYLLYFDSLRQGIVSMH